MVPVVLSQGTNPCVTHVIHIADLHVRIGNRDTARINEYEHVFTAFCNEIALIPAVKNKTAILIIAGDVFHNKGRLDSVAGKMFFLWINRLLQLLPIFVICGNHDYRQEDPTFTDMIELFTAPYVNRPLYYLNTTGLYIWENLVFGVTSIKDTLRAFNTAGMVDELSPFPDPRQVERVDCRIALFHGTLTSSTLQSDHMIQGYSLDWFNGYDIAMLGDNHKQQLHCYGSMPWGYPGSLVQQDFGEPTFGHGYILWDIPTRSGTLHHVPNPFGSITIEQVDNEYTVFFAPKMKMLLNDAINNVRTPSHPRIRIIGNEADVTIVQQRLLDTSILPQSLKFVHVAPSPATVAAAPQGQEPEPTSAIQRLADLNQPDQWESYIKTIDPSLAEQVHNYIFNPSTMLIPISPHLPPDTNANINIRNAKLTTLLDVYEQRVTHTKQRVSLIYMEWEYLMCYERNNHFRFADLNGQVALLNGPNASGKSAFMDVLSIALFGEPTSSRRDFSGDSMSAKIIFDHKPEGESSYVILQFELDNKLFEIHRSFSYASSSASKQQDIAQQKICVIYEIINNERIMTAEGTTTVTQWIQTTVGTLEELQMSTMLCQHDSSNFFFQRPMDQRQILERALNIETITAYENILAEAVKAHKYVLAEVITYHKGLVDNLAASSSTTLTPTVTTSEITQQLATCESELSSLMDKSRILGTKIGSDPASDLDSASETELQTIQTERSLLGFIAPETRDKLLLHQGELNHQHQVLLSTAQRLNVSVEDTFHPASIETLRYLEQHHVTKPTLPLTVTEITGNDINSLEMTLQTARDKLTTHLQHIPPHTRSILQCRETIGGNEDAQQYADVFMQTIREPRNTLTTDVLPFSDIASSIAKLAVLKSTITELEQNPILLCRPMNNPQVFHQWTQAWCEWETFAASVPDQSTDELNLQLSVRTIQTEIEDIRRIDFNPDCWACCKQPKWVRLQELTRQLNSLNPAGKMHSSRFLEKHIPRRAEYERRVNHMAEECDAWERATEEFALETGRLQQLAVIVAEHDQLECKLWNSCQHLREVLNAMCELECAHVFAEWNQQLTALQAAVEVAHNTLWCTWTELYTTAKAQAEALLWKQQWDQWVQHQQQHQTESDHFQRCTKLDERIRQIEGRLALQEWNHVQLNIRKITETQSRLRECLLRQSMGDTKTALILSIITSLQSRFDIIKSLQTRFVGEKQEQGFKTFVYKERVLPMIEHEVNDFLSSVDTFRLRIRIKGTRFIYLLEDRGNLPTLDHASGYQRFMVTLGMRIALSRMGVVGQNLSHLFLDEGFTACDSVNLQKISELLQDILVLGGYKCILLMSHLDTIRDSTQHSIPILRTPENHSSQLQFGIKRIPLPKGCRVGGTTPKVRGRPRKQN